MSGLRCGSMRIGYHSTPEQVSSPGRRSRDWSVPMILLLVVLSLLLFMMAAGRAHSRHLDARDARWNIRADNHGPLAS